jgi:hypothetical protein
MIRLSRAVNPSVGDAAAQNTFVSRRSKTPN